MQEKIPPSEPEKEGSSIHHPGDKSFKVAMKVKASALEFVEQFFPELYAHLDINSFELDNTNYITKDFDEFYSDVVYRTYLKQSSSKTKKPVAVALLFEHKKTISSYFTLFLQLLEYIILIWKDDLANKRKPSLIIPIVVFQGKRGLKTKQMHDCFRGIPRELLPFIPNFACHLTNVHELPDDRILSLDQKGLLRSLFLAYTYTERKESISNILTEIFKFFDYEPERFDFFQLIFEFIAKEDYLSGDEVEELFNHYLSPKTKKKMLTTYQVWKGEGRKEGRQEGEIKKARLVVLRGRWKGLSADFLADVSELPYPVVENLLEGYEQTYRLWKEKKTDKTVEHLSKEEVNYLLDLFDKNQN